MSNTVAELKRTEKKLLLEIAKYESDRVKSVVASGKNAIVCRSDGGMEFINRVVGDTKDALKGTGLVLVLAIGEPKTSGPVVVVGDKEAVEKTAAKIKETIKDVKGGGGAGDKWQGKVPEWRQEDLNTLRELVED